MNIRVKFRETYQSIFIQFHYLIYRLTLLNIAVIRIFYRATAHCFLEGKQIYMENSRTSCSEYVSPSSSYMREDVKSIWEWIGWFRVFAYRCFESERWITRYFLRLFLQTIRFQKYSLHKKKNVHSSPTAIYCSNFFKRE